MQKENHSAEMNAPATYHKLGLCKVDNSELIGSERLLTLILGKLDLTLCNLTNQGLYS